MLEKEDLEAVLIATPLLTHADLTVACLDAGKHVLCEKMMAWDVPGCHRMAEAARWNSGCSRSATSACTTRPTRRPTRASSRRACLGDIHYVRNVWHRNKTWRRNEEPPSPDFDPKPWGYETGSTS